MVVMALRGVVSVVIMVMGGKIIFLIMVTRGFIKVLIMKDMNIGLKIPSTIPIEIL